MIKVAGYCRVSTHKEDQLNSFEAQQRYFREMIDRHANWELYEIYADEGISGTAAENRTQFLRMLHDAKNGSFQLVLTKEISRFSRNLKDTLEYTRELKRYGVGVLFENENINTLNTESEMYLSILGSVAQEESRNISNRVKWGQTRQMERGVVFGRSFLGYDVENGKISIEPEGAKLIRLIFYKYGIEKKGTSVIARELQEEGYHTYTGNTKWNANHIIKILKNEKYAGDLVQKKTYTPDYLTHRKKTKHGAEQKVILKNHHEPIISRELWNIVQEELQKRRKSRNSVGTPSNCHLLSGKIRCGECGRNFIAKARSDKNGLLLSWRCYTAATEGRYSVDSYGESRGCNIGKLLRNDTAMEMLQSVLCSLSLEREKIAEHIASLAADAILSGQKNGRDTPEQLLHTLQKLLLKKDRMLDIYFSEIISKEEMEHYRERYVKEEEQLQQRLAEAENRVKSTQSREAIRERAKQEVLALLNGEQISEILYNNLLDHMTVYRDGRVILKLNHLEREFIFVPECRK